MNSSPPLVVRAESAAQWQPKYLPFMSIAFVTCLLVSNLAAVKLFRLGPAVFTAGVLVFPISYIFGDCLCELYGYERTRRVVWYGLFANLFMTSVLWIATLLPAAETTELQGAFDTVYRFVPRIVVGSVVAYWTGEIINSFVMSRMKVASGGRRFALRAAASTAAGQLVDSILFVLIAFSGQYPLGILVAAIVSGWAFKVVYEIIALPFTSLFVQQMKRIEGYDHFDMVVDYNPIKL